MMRLINRKLVYLIPIIIIYIPAVYAIDVEHVNSDRYSFTNDDQITINNIAEKTEYEVRKILPLLPKKLILRVTDSKNVIPLTGESAAANSTNEISWFVDAERDEGVSTIAKKYLRFELFHEMFHLARKIKINNDSPIIDRVINEGLATAFASHYSQEPVLWWGEYTESEVEKWVPEVLELPDDASIGRWLYFHPDGRRYIGYKVGMYLVNKASQNSGKSIVDLAEATSKEIIKFAGY